MNRLFLTWAFVAFLGLGLFGQAQIAHGQINLTWNGGGVDSNWSTAANWDFIPDPNFDDDSLKFTGTTGLVNNNDFATDALQIGLGGGTGSTSGAIHFLSGAGDFVIGGNAVVIGPNGHGTLVRADVGAGTTQTLNLPINFFGGNKRRTVALNNNGTVIFNGDVNFANDIMFIGEAAGTIELNGNNTGTGLVTVTSPPGTNAVRSVIRVNDDGGFGTEIVLGSNTALGDAGSGDWAAGTLQLRGIQTVAAAYVSTSAPLDLSGYHFQLNSGSGSVGGSVNYRSVFDSTIGYVTSAGANRDLKIGDVGELTIANGIFTSSDDTARQLNIVMSGSSGNIPGANGQVVVNGPLYNTLIDPISAASAGNSSRGGIAVGSQRTAQDGTLVNGTLRANFGTITLNADSSTTWIGGEYRAINGSTTIVGNANAFGDSDSIIDIDSGSKIDLNGNTIAQRLEQIDGNGVTGTEGALVNSNIGTPAGVTSDIVDIGLFGVGGAGDIELQNVFHSALVTRSITKWGTGTLTLSGTLRNTRYGLTVNEGRVNLNKSTPVNAVSNQPLNINNGSLVVMTSNASDAFGFNNQLNNNDSVNINDGTLDLAGNGEGIGTLNGGVNGIIESNVAPHFLADARIAIGAGDLAADGVWDGTIRDGTFPVSVRKGRGNVQVFNGTNTYTGDTIITDNGFGTGVLEVNGSITSTSKMSNENGTTLRGTGMIASPDWNLHGTVQAGGATPTATDVLTLDMSASIGTPMLFQSDSTISFALDAGMTSSTINVLGSLSSIVVFDNSTFDFTDLTAGSLALGTYTLFDGDANTNYILGGSVTLSGLGAYPGSTLSVSGNDVVLNLLAGVPGDFDGDDDVDGFDFLTWQRGGSPDGGTQAELTLWETNFGTVPPPAMASSFAVPEPSSLLLLVSGLVACGMRRRMVW